jgi:hypothetical protein
MDAKGALQMEHSIRISDTFLEKRLAQMGVRYEGRAGQDKLFALVLFLSALSIALMVRMLFPAVVP